MQQIRYVGVASFTEQRWFASLSMWLFMQELIDEYHDELPHLSYKCPKIKNLSLIPICGHVRKPVKIDGNVLFCMMSDLKLIFEAKWKENQKIGDRVKRLCHFLVNSFYVGSERDQGKKGKEKKLLFGRWSGHTHAMHIDGTVDEFMTVQRLCDIKSNGIYFDLVPANREYYLAGESIAIDQLAELQVQMKNIKGGEPVRDIIDGYDSDNFCSVGIYSALRCLENFIAVKETSDADIEQTKRIVAAKEKKFRIDPLVHFYNDLLAQLNGTASQQLAIAAIETTLNASRVKYFVKHLVDCNVFALKNGLLAKIDCGPSAPEPQQSAHECKRNRFDHVLHHYIFGLIFGLILQPLRVYLTLPIECC